jgi:hypothetical protein
MGGGDPAGGQSGRRGELSGAHRRRGEEFVLPATDVSVPVHFGSGARKVTLLRPPGAAATLRRKHGFTSLSLDGERIGTSPRPTGAVRGRRGRTGGYELTVGAGSNHLTIA